MADDATALVEALPNIHLGLHSVPPEIFLKIVEYIDTAKDIANLSRTCQRFRALNHEESWRTFVQIKFPSLISSHLPGMRINYTDWRELAISLTAQSRAWDKRAISMKNLEAWTSQAVRLQNAFESAGQYSQSLDPYWRFKHCPLYQWDDATKSVSLFDVNGRASVHHNRMERGGRLVYQRPQTAHFHPVIDTKLEFAGDISSKKEIVAWSTGSEVFVRVRRSGSLMPGSRDDLRDHCPSFDGYGNKINWFTIQHEQFLSGSHDVTSINLVDPSTQIRAGSEENLVVDFVVGRASGHLHRYSVSNVEPVRVVKSTFISNEVQGSALRRSVQSTDLNKNSTLPLLVACSNKSISLYNTAEEQQFVLPLTEIELQTENPQARAWTSKFSSSEKLLVGLGQSLRPLHSYQATPTGLILTGKFGETSDTASPIVAQNSIPNSVYAIEPLPRLSSAGGSSGGDVFISGWYDGGCRLFDLRTGRSPVTTYRDSVNGESAIYSMATFGEERFLAGTANSVLNVFDYRNGAKAYYYTDGLTCSAIKPSPDPLYSLYHTATTGGHRSTRTRSEASLATTQDTIFDNENDRNKCCYNVTTGQPKLCNFHRLSRLDIYRPNINIYIYGYSPRSGNRGHPREKSPIFSLSSASPICPVVYAGTTGAITELEISEFSATGDVLDPYFASPSEAAHVGQTLVEEMAMYETYDGQSGGEGEGVPTALWWQPSRMWPQRRGGHKKSSNRLDGRWKKYGQES